MLIAMWRTLMKRTDLRYRRCGALDDEVDKATQSLRRAQEENQRAVRQARAAYLRSLTATEQARNALCDLARRMREDER